MRTPYYRPYHYVAIVLLITCAAQQARGIATTGDLAIRRACARDAPLVAELLAETFEAPTLRWFEFPERLRRMRRYRQAIESRIGKEDHLSLVAVRSPGDEVVAFVEAGMLPPPPGALVGTWEAAGCTPKDLVAHPAEQNGDVAFNSAGVISSAGEEAQAAPPPPPPDDVPYLANLCVSSALQRRGLGGRLVAAASAWAQERSHGAVYVAVDRGNTGARALYGRLGFMEVAPPGPTESGGLQAARPAESGGAGAGAPFLAPQPLPRRVYYSKRLADFGESGE